MTRWFKFASLALLCAACQATAPAPSPLPSLSPSPPPPSPTPVPAVQLSSYRLLAGPNPSEWRLIGLVENRGAAVVSDIELQVMLRNANRQVIAEAPERVSISNLMPGESGPFFATFELDEDPTDAAVEVLQFNTTQGQRGALETEFQEFFLTGSGELGILGFVSNTDTENISLDSLVFLGLGSDGSEKSFARMLFGPENLEPGEKIPILVVAPENPGTVRWKLYHDSLIAEERTSASLEVLGEITLRVTAQGAPFVVGTVVNSGESAMAGAVLVAMYEQNRLIGLWEIETPRPLEPGEQLSFSAFGFPGINLRFDPQDLDAVRVETRVDSRLVSQMPEPVDLPIDISSFISVGSALFLRGTVRNPLDADVESTAVFAEVRTTDGDLVSAGWSTLGLLQAGYSADFVLDLPIPAGMDPTLTEYDLRAIALSAGQ